MSYSHSDPAPLLGLVHLYDSQKRLTAFESGDIESPNTVIFIGGLGDGLHAVPYLTKLSDSLTEIQWSLTQVLLTSSYTGFGCSNIEQDAEEIKTLVAYFKRLGKARFVLLGHSTGCQDIIRYFNPLRPDPDPQYQDVVGIVLQAPVSDRQYILDTLGEEKYQASLKAAQQLIRSGEPTNPIPNEFSDTFSGGRCTISASRWLSLASSLQDLPTSEDFFSSDLPDDTLHKNLASVAQQAIPSLVVISGRDETMPRSIDKDLHLQRLVKGLTQDASLPFAQLCRASSSILQQAGHQVEESSDELCYMIVEFIRAASALS